MIDSSKHDESDPYEDRRTVGRLTDDELEAIARRAADIVWENFTLQVGKTAIRLFLYVLGAVVIAVLAWFGLNQKMKLP